MQGGGTQSDAVILDENGKLLSEAQGSCTNPWLVGFEGCVDNLSTLIADAKRNAGIPVDEPLESLGMALSGGEQSEAQEKIITGLQGKFPNTSRHYCVRTDTFGSIATAFQTGGMVLISGTGSNCELLNPDGSTHRCGGWGHVLGDEGSGFWIAHKAIKIVYDANDGLAVPPYDVTVVKGLIWNYFKIKQPFDILDFLYTNFKKSFIAKLCKELAEAARTSRDPLALHIFKEAGIVLGKHIKALLPKADQSLLTTPGGLHVLAVGSVLTHCWDLLQEGLLEALRGSDISTITIVKLKVSSAFGAAVLGSKAAGSVLNIDLSTNTSLLYSGSPGVM